MKTLDLCGDWRMVRVDTGESWPARVPGCNFTDLLRAGAICDPFFGRNEYDLHWIDDTDWEYRREFVVEAGMLGEERVEIVCEGLDTLAEVVVNGQVAGRADNMFRSWRFDVSSILREGLNSILVKLFNPTAYCQRKVSEWNHRIDDGAAFLGSLIRKQHSSFSWDWAPSLPPSGMHRPIRIEGSSGPRLRGCRILQAHEPGRVLLDCTVEFECAKANVRWQLSLRGQAVAEGVGERVTLCVEAPELWWPNGQGAQPLYDLDVAPADSASAFEPVRRRIGLRTITLEKPEDEFGQAFFFSVNGRAVYAKGANWAPPHQWASEVTPELYADLLRSARSAHFNMIRVWGGGLYEQDAFYDLCDELGLLVWHDFMFSCSLYPAASAFLENITLEAEEQTRRLAHRACLALWCGNNELEHFIEHIKKTPEREAAFLRVFYDILPGVVARNASQTAYWPGSPHNPKGWDQGPSVEDGGDGHHYWTGWNNTGLPEGGTDRLFRFCSEFGLQSFPSTQLIETFTPEHGRNWFSPEIESHEKSPGMLTHMLRDMGRLYRLPADFGGQVFASQLVQARHLQTAIEHHRRHLPRCMGSLFWQLNDTWPAISWSTIEFGGRWKPAHYAVRRAFASTIVSVVIRQVETHHLHARTTVQYEVAELYVVHDGPAAFAGRLEWRVLTVKGAVLLQDRCDVRVSVLSSVQVAGCALAPLLRDHAPEDVVVECVLRSEEGMVVARRTVFLVPPKEVRFEDGEIVCERTEERVLTLRSATLRHGVWISFEDAAVRLSDNGFDLLPGEPVRVVIEEGAERAASYAVNCVS